MLPLYLLIPILLYGFCFYFIFPLRFVSSICLSFSPFLWEQGTDAERRCLKTNLSRLMSHRPLPAIHPGRYVPLRAFVAWDTVRISTYSTGADTPGISLLSFDKGRSLTEGWSDFDQPTIDIHVLNSRRRVWRLVLSCFLFSWK